jgi:hypothetical protein
VSLQKRTGVFSLEHYPASQTLLWAGHVARMPKSRSTKKLMLPWVMETRIAGGQKMTCGRSLGRYLKRFGQARADGSAPAFTEWTNLAQDRAGWRKLVTERPFDVGKQHVRPPRITFGGSWRSAPPKSRSAAPSPTPGRHADTLSRAPQQQPNHELFPPRGESLPLPLSPTHTTNLRGATQNLRGGAPHKESQPTSEITPPHTSGFHSRTRPCPAHP